MESYGRQPSSVEDGALNEWNDRVSEAGVSTTAPGKMLVSHLWILERRTL